jgi:hypothetical protein
MACFSLLPQETKEVETMQAGLAVHPTPQLSKEFDGSLENIQIPGKEDRDSSKN